MSASMSIPGIIVYKPYDKPDELEQEWKTRYLFLIEKCQDQSDEQINQILQVISTSSPELHSGLVCALIFGILIDQNAAPKFLQHLQLLTHDRFALCVTHVRDLVNHKYCRLKKSVREQLLWLLNALLEFDAYSLDTLAMTLLRHIPTGDTQLNTIWLVEQMLKIFSNKSWLYDQTELIPIIVYTFLTIIPDHFRPYLDSIRQQEIALCVELLRQKWELCQVIGRDLVRLVYNISRIKEIEQLWKDVFLTPVQIGSPPPVRTLCSTPTPKHFLISRMMPEMENWLCWLLKNVPFGSQKRYQIWFANRYLALPENDALIPDLVRWICGANHPSKSVVKSDIVPRWAILGWLITSARTPHWSQYAKQSLFYDWIFYVPNKDNIMNLEPGLLVITNSLGKYAELSASLTEYLMHLADTYLSDSFPQMIEDIKLNLGRSFRALLQYKVVSNLDSLFSCPMIRPVIREKIKKIIDGPQVVPSRSKEVEEENEEQRTIEFKNTGNMHLNIPEEGHQKPTQRVTVVDQTSKVVGNKPEKTNETSIRSTTEKSDSIVQNRNSIMELQKNVLDNKKSTLESKFESTEEKTISALGNSKSNFTKHPHHQVDPDNEEDINFSLKWKEAVSNSDLSIGPEIDSNELFSSPLEDPLSIYRPLLLQFGQLWDTSILEGLLTLYETNITDENDPVIPKLAKLLIETLYNELIQPLKLSNALNQAISKILEWYCRHFQRFNSTMKFNGNGKKDDENKSNINCIFELLIGLFHVENTIGYRLMAYLVAKHNFLQDEPMIELSVEISEADLYKYLEPTKTNPEKYMNPYIHFLNLKLRKNESLFPNPNVAMLQDAILLAENDLDLFNELIPYWFRDLKEFSANCEALIQLVVQYCMPASILNITTHLALNKYRIIDSKIGPLLVNSLEWDSISQTSFWVLVNAEFRYCSDFLVEKLGVFLENVNPLVHVECLTGLQQFLIGIKPSKIGLKTMLLAPLSLTQWVETIMTCWARDHSETFAECLIQALDSICDGLEKVTNIKLAMLHLVIWCERFFNVTAQIFERVEFVKRITILRNRNDLKELCSLILKKIGEMSTNTTAQILY